MSEQSHKVAGSDLRQRLQVIEKLIAEQADLKELEKEAFSAAKAEGYDIPTLRKVIARRKKDSDKLAEEDALMQMYEEAVS